MTRWPTLEDLSPIERELFEEARHGNLDPLANHYFQPAMHGSRWWPDEAIGHYRDLFTFEFLDQTWRDLGKPPEFTVEVSGTPVDLKWVPDIDGYSYLLHHGYIFLDWARPFVDIKTNLGMVISGTGTAKTSSVAIAALLYCAMFPGFEFLNAGPSEKQARLMVKEIEQWVTESEFRKFLEFSHGGRKTHVDRPNVKYTIHSPYNPAYPSHIQCQTIGNNANAITGLELDWVDIDEIQYVLGLEEAMGPTMTRMRAMRPDGTPRSVKLTMISNPGDNPEMDQVRAKVKKNVDAADPDIRAVLIEGLTSDVNPYITRRQLKRQASMLDELDIARWQEGDNSGIVSARELPETLLNNCRSAAMDNAISKFGLYSAKKKSGVGLAEYQIPYQQGHAYIVSGDPGMSDFQRLSVNNVPVVTVFDITGFPDRPTPLQALYILDGGGTYKPWLAKFKQLMVDYQCMGFYDATNLRSAWEDQGTFGLYPTQPVFFDANSKPWAKTIFVTLAQNKMFEWPYISALWYQASVYRSSGEGIKKLADDLLASIWVFCLALRIEGTIWTKLTDRFHRELASAESPITAPPPRKKGVASRWRRPVGVRR